MKRTGDSMRKIPDVIYVTLDGDKGEEYLLANESLEECPEGSVTVFKKTEVLEVRTVTEIRRQWTKTWFKP